MTKLTNVLKPTISFVICVSLAGCVSTANRQVVSNDPYYTPITPTEEAQNIVPTGSLFNSYSSNDMYSDKKAVRVGDIITVMLKESTQASKSAKTETDKESEYNLDPIVGLGGKNVNIGGQSIQLGMKSGGSFTGEGKSNQSNSLSGNITVNVITPGPVLTQNFWDLVPKDSELQQEISDNIPVGRIGTTGDIANAVEFFLDEKASFVTGQVLYVCGGTSLKGLGT